ncbi:DUF2079 domain-containing protein [Kitasatospora sp. CB01950]|uniref:DUF2079 domain-containing protein n=1 Tax=Kitasatospora sp. CB01950 TaxID=1703930 RepID=UPI000A80267F|nr:DUF2079 domain-containing protein [Kitasatospora sp. CB01950]
MRILSRVRPCWLPVLPVLLFQLALSLPRHWRMQTNGFDLGIFEEAVRGYAYLGPPVVTLKGAGYVQLGDHFSPALAVLAPFYRLWPAPETLLVAQAVLFALSVVPVTDLAVQWLGRSRGVLAGLAYGLSWGLWQASLFDMHEIALAVPLLACTTVALARGRWRAAVCWALPLLLVKEDQGLLLAGVGGYVLLVGRRRGLGVATLAAAVLGTLLTVLVLIPAANPLDAWSYGATAAPGGGDPLTRLLWPSDKWWTLAALLAPTLLLALRSPLVLLAALPLAARYWSSNPAYWSTGWHYNAVLMPIVFVAALDGLRRLPARPALRFAPAAMLLVALCAAPTPDLSRPSADVLTARQVLATVPDGARVAAANRLAPQLTSRCTVSLFPYLTFPSDAGSTRLSPDDRHPLFRPVAEWAATLDAPDGFPTPTPADLTAQNSLATAGYHPVARGAGITVWHWQPS